MKSIILKNFFENGIMGHFISSFFVGYSIIEESKLNLTNLNGRKVSDQIYTFIKNKKLIFVYDTAYSSTNLFDSIFDQENHKPFCICPVASPRDLPFESFKFNSCIKSPYLSSEGIIFNGKVLSKNCPNLKLIASIIKFKKNILEELNRFYNNSEGKTLGVHIRLTDMNKYHGDIYGVCEFKDYLKKISKIEKQYTNIFVASDNVECINILKNIYGKKIKTFNHLSNISPYKDDINFYNQTLLNAKNKKAWVEVYLDVLALSKSDFLLCRTSSIPLCSILFSDNLKLIDNYELVNS